MRCAKTRKKVLELIDDELPLSELPELDEHLERCASCREFRRAHVKIEELVTVTPAPETEAAFEDAFLARLNRALDARSGSPRLASRRVAAGAALIAVAAGLTLLALLWWTQEEDPDTAASSVVTGAMDTVIPEPISDAVAAAPPSAGPDAFDPERLAQVKESIRETLVNVEEPTKSETVSKILAELEPLARERWPLGSLVGGFVQADDIDVARKAVDVLVAIPSSGTSSYLREACTRKELREAALRAGVKTHPATLVPFFVQALDDPSLFEIGLQGLQQAGTSMARKALQARLEEEFSGKRALFTEVERASALHALAQMRVKGEERQGATALLQVLEAGAPSALVTRELQALGETGKQAVLEALAGRIGGVPVESAIQLAGTLKIKEAIASLETLLRREPTMAAAARALGEIATPSSFGAIVERYLQLSGAKEAILLVEGANRALESGHMTPSELIAAAAAANNRDRWTAFVKLIEQSGGDVAAAVLVELFTDTARESAVRLASAHALARIGSERHLAFLIEWAATHGDTSPEVGGAAVVAARRIGGPGTVARLEARLERPLPPEVRRTLERSASARGNAPPEGSLRQIGRALAPDSSRAPPSSSSPSPPSLSPSLSPAPSRSSDSASIPRPKVPR
ncbi:MAG: HEAT repeat domain-containing protein [Planctomycetota bacterium]